MDVYGCFLKWWYPPQNTPKWSFLVGKLMVDGYHHFRKPPYMKKYMYQSINGKIKTCSSYAAGLFNAQVLGNNTAVCANLAWGRQSAALGGFHVVWVKSSPGPSESCFTLQVMTNWHTKSLVVLAGYNSGCALRNVSRLPFLYMHPNDENIWRHMIRSHGR